MGKEGTTSRGLRRLWVASAWMFVLAALAGVYFRWGMLFGFAEGIKPHYLRHGHSHLMLMGWATPALMALMAARWPTEGGRAVDRTVCFVGWTSWVLAVLSFPAFILYGYESVSLGSASLPIAAILSGFAIFAWYGFAAVYFGANRGVPRTPAMRLWDLAVLALVVSSLGAWAIAGLMMAGVDNVLWEAASVHFFVDLFGAGWLVLGTLGLLRSLGSRETSSNERYGRILVAVSIGLVFLVGLPRAYLSFEWVMLGSFAAALSAAGLFLIVAAIWSDVSLWPRRVLLLLAIKIAMLAAVAFPPLAEWGLRAGLRLFYLHLAFAGVVTLGLVVTAHVQWGWRAVGSRRAWLVCALVLLATLIPLTGLWPRELAGVLSLQAAFYGSVMATGASCLALLVPVWRRKEARKVCAESEAQRNKFA